MYEKESPAADIRTLVRFLTKKNILRQFFRGQNQFRKVNAPSGLRRAINGNQHANWNEFDKDHWKKVDHRTQARTDLKIGILTFFGRALGNILCQQYGISSDAFDITDDPRIAAFFATHRYPTYEPFVPKANEEECGVIYRFSIKDPPPVSTAIEETIDSLYFAADARRKIAFTEVIMLMGAALHGLIGTSAKQFIDEHIPGEKASVELTRPAMYLGYDTIRRLFLQRFKERKLRGNAAAYFDSSRIYRQRGGIFYPSMRHTAITNRIVHAGERIGKKLFRGDPPTALSLGPTHVYELNADFSVEPFFFRHSLDENIKIDNLNLLWPDTDNDYIFQLICGLAENECKKYLADYKIEVLDHELGVVDRGFRIVA